MNAIKLHQIIYTVSTKNGRTYQVPEQEGLRLQKVLSDTENHSFIPLGSDTYNQFQIMDVVRNELSNDVDVFIMRQPKAMREKIYKYSKSNNLRRNSINHVNNFISANQ